MNPLTKRLLALGASSIIAITGGYLIQPWEGKANHAYKDLVGVPTLCFGETKSVRMGDYKTDEECEKSLASELAAYNENMKRNVTVPLKEYEEIAYTSFVWNIGETKWNSSTLLKKLNAGDSLGACKEILKWNKATFTPSAAERQRKAGETCTAKTDGNFSCTVKGLTNRRVAEYNVCTNQNTEVSDALQALQMAAQAPINVDQGEDHSNAKEAVVESSTNESPMPPPPIILPEVAPVVCKIKFLGICFKKGPAY